MEIGMILDEIKENEILKDFFDMKCDLCLTDEEICKDCLESLTDFGISNYELQPFAVDGEGGVYVTLNNQMVGYLTTDGESDIVAENIEEFFGLVICCQMLYDYRRCLKDRNEFIHCVSTLEELDEETNEELKKFTKKHGLITDVEMVYDQFIKAVSVEPKFIIKATDPDYSDTESMFEL